MKTPTRRREFEVIDGGSSPVEPAVDPFSLTDYLQLAGLTKQSLLLEVRDGVDRGRIVVRQGEVWSAHDALGEGEEAFGRLLSASLARRVPARCLALPHTTPERNVRVSLASLLMDGARRFDEGRREASAPLTTDHFQAFYEEGVEALLRRDYTEAYAAFAGARRLHPDDPTVNANLARLVELGHVPDGAEGESR